MALDRPASVRRAVEAFNRGDWDGFLANTSEDFELDLSRASGPEHGIFGRDEARSLLERFAESWESLRIEGDELIESGDHVIAEQTLHARGREGIDVPSTVTWVWTFDGDLATRAAMFQERGDALRAAGASA
jgi:ketosteroid isomerase-like protein